ncbi:MAG: ThiF family adenylyltransferase [Acidobacteria bacterium]|nr:ThiF family adenylyltransferase [Acidobacteriota bacterium]
MVFQLKEQNVDEDDPFERQRRIEWWDQNTLRKSKMMIIGAGALGNETLKNLALLGVGGLFIVDFDTISGSNLSRTVLFRKQDIGREKAAAAAEAIKDLALESSAKVEYFHGDMVWDLGLGVYRRMNVVLSCVDNDEARLATNRACRSVGVPWINAGILGLSGNVMIFGKEGVCYECNVTPEQIEDARSRYDSCESVRKRFLQEEKMPTVQVTSALISALQVQEAIKLIHNQQPAIGKRIAVNGLTNGFLLITLQPLDECLAHGSYENIKELPLSAHENTLEELFLAIEENLGEGVTLDLGRRFILEIRCRYCGKILPLMRPAHRIFDDELICNSCSANTEQHTHSPLERIEGLTSKIDDQTYVKSVSRFSRKEIPNELLGLKLWDLGVPPLHILSAIGANNEQKAFELTADSVKVLGNLISI